MTLYPPSVTSSGWSSRTKRIVVLICLLLVGIALWQLTEILPIVVVALVLSYLLYPLAAGIDRALGRLDDDSGPSRSAVSVLITFLVVVAIFALVVVLIFPVLFNQLQEFLNRIPSLLEGLEAQARVWLSEPIIIAGQEIVPIEGISEFLGTTGEGVASLADLNIPDALAVAARSLTGPAFSFLGGAVSVVINAVFLLTLMFYLIKDGAHFVNVLVRVTPSSYEGDARRLFYELGQVWNAYLRGQLILSVTMGALVFLAALLLGVPNAPILGLLSGLFEFIPTLGPLLALIPAALLAVGSQSSTLPFLEGVPFALVVIVVWTALQNIEAVVLVPRIMGDSLDLHPFVVVVGVLAGAAVAGALGVILAAPVLASLRVIGEYLYGKLLDRDPFPPPDPQQLRAERRASWSHRVNRQLRSWRSWMNRQLNG